MQKKVKRIIEEVCKKHNVPSHIGLKVWKIPYRILREETAEKYGTFDPLEYPEVKIPFIGSFYTNSKKISDVKAALEKQKEENGEN